MIKFYFSSSKIIESDFILNDYSFTEVYHNNLSTAENSVKVKVPFDTELANNLKIYGDTDVKVEIKENNKIIFTDILRKDFNFEKTQKNLPVSLEILSPAVLLDTELGENISFIDKQVWQIIQLLLSRVKLSLAKIPPLNKVVPVFTAEEKDTIYDLIEGLCFESGYVFDFNEYGKCIVNPLFDIPTSTDTITQFFDGTNINETISITKKEEEYNTVIAKWKKIEYFTDALIFSDTQKGDENNKCKIEIPADSFIFDREENYIEYDSTLGKILYVINITKDSGITWNLENYGRHGLLKAKNTTAKPKRITKFDIYGNAYIQTAVNETKTTHGKKSKEIEVKYLNSVSDVEMLVNNIQNYYSYADYTIKLKSKWDYKVGSFVKVSENGMGTIYARIIKKTSYKQKTFSYELEAISEFTPAEIKTKLTIPSTKNSKDGRDGRDGTTKLLPSLEVQGDYENQIGTYQGQLYRWFNNKWELLNAVMPLNPVCYYDFEELSQIQPQNIIFKNSSPIFENKTPTIFQGQRVPNNQWMLIETYCTFTGNATPFLYVYNEDWSKVPFQAFLNGKEKYCLYIPDGANFYCGLWMNGSISYIPKEEDSVTLKEIIISKITDIVLDKSGNENNLYIKSGTKYILPKTENNIKGSEIQSVFLQTKKDIFDKEITISMFFKPECIPDSYHHIFEINGITPFVKNNILVDYPYETFRYELQKNKLIHFVVTITKTQVQIFIDTKLIGTSNRDTEYESKILTLGTWNSSYGFYKGFMAQVLVFDKVLTQQEILWLYHNPQYPVKTIHLPIGL